MTECKADLDQVGPGQEVRIHGRRLKLLEVYPGLNTVFLATDLDTSQKVIAKKLKRFIAPDEPTGPVLRGEEAFRFRLMYAASLDGRVQAGLSESIRRNGMSLYEFVPGESVRDGILAAPFENRLGYLDNVAPRFLQTLEVLRGRGLVYRDIKPENMVREHLIDFDMLSTLRRANESKGVLGTPWTMAPEVIARRGWHAGSDAYSLGVSFAAVVLPPKKDSDILSASKIAVAPVPFFETQYGNELLSLLDKNYLRANLNRRPSSEEVDKVGEAITLIKRLVKSDPNARPRTADEALDGLSLGRPQVSREGYFRSWVRKTFGA